MTPLRPPPLLVSPVADPLLELSRSWATKACPE
jgi:hypothetical protein